MGFLNRIKDNFPCQVTQLPCRFQSIQGPHICLYIKSAGMDSDQNKIVKEMIRANNKTIPLMYLQSSDKIINSFARYLLQLPHCPFPRNPK